MGKHSEYISDAEANKIIKRYDKDNDNEISFTEVIFYFENYNSF